MGSRVGRGSCLPLLSPPAQPGVSPWPPAPCACFCAFPLDKRWECGGRWEAGGKPLDPSPSFRARLGSVQLLETGGQGVWGEGDPES